MTQLIFLADIHDKDNTLTESLKNANADNLKGSIAVLLELDEGEDGDYLIPKSEYDDVLSVIFKDKINSADHKLVKELMIKSNNSVYAFDSEGSPTSLNRQKGQRKNICAILKKTDAKDKNYVLVIDGIGHLQYQKEINNWIPLQITPPKYPNVDNIITGFPNNESINGINTG